jgi:hypothetical protein
MSSATSAATSPSYSIDAALVEDAHRACTCLARSPGGWPKVENASSAIRGS